MADADFEMDEKQKQIDRICREVIQQFKAGDYHKAAKSLKTALECYPDNKKLNDLLGQFKLKVRDNKIRKLEDEAMVLIHKGADEMGQKKLREILKLDPSRTDLKGSLRKLRSESQEDYYSDMRKEAVKRICLYVALSILFVVATSISVAAYDNRKKLKNAKKDIDNKYYRSAILELDECGWFMAGGKSDLYDQILTSKENLKEEAEDYAGKKEYVKAIQLLQRASRASIIPDEFNEEIKHFQNLEKAKLKAKAKAQKDQSEAQEAKYDCESTAKKTNSYNSIIETSHLMSEAKNLSDEAKVFMAANDFVQAKQRWNQSTQKYNEVATISIKIDKEQRDALLAKDQCQSIHYAAQKINAEIETTDMWDEATKTFALANKQLDDRQFVQARQSWINAASKYTEAIDICRRSPSYLKAQDEFKKWNGLGYTMAEASVRKLLGAPNCSLMGSDSGMLFYQDVPRVASENNGEVSIVYPKSGYVEFKNAGLDVSLENEKKKYDKAVKGQNRRHEADLKRLENIPEQPRETSTREANGRRSRPSKVDLLRKIESAHREKMTGIEEDHETKTRLLTDGVISFKSIYLISQWVNPDPDAVTSTLVSPQRQEDETDVEWEVQSNWRKLKTNMDQRNVLKVLGSFDNTNVVGSKVFRYGDIQGFAELKFKQCSDGQLRLTYWKEPLWTAVW